MALPASGQIDFGQIRTELNVTGQAPFGINEAEAGTYATLKPCQPGPVVRSNPNGSTPNTMNEWWGYDHSYVMAGCYASTLATGTGYTNACSNFSNNINKSTYYLSGSCYPLAASCVIYSTQCCTGTVSATYYSDGTNAFSYDGGVTDSGQSCAATTTTTSTTSTTTAAPVCTCTKAQTCSDECPTPGAPCTVTDPDCFI